MPERPADTTICIPVEEYKELIATAARYEDLLRRFWEQHTRLEALRKSAAQKPYFGEKEDCSDASHT